MPTRDNLSEITYLTSKTEISDQPTSVAVRQYPFVISHEERQWAKCDREEAEFAVYLRQPLLLSSNYNCDFWEERIQDKSLNTGHELAAFCDPSA